MCAFYYYSGPSQTLIKRGETVHVRTETIKFLLTATTYTRGKRSSEGRWGRGRAKAPAESLMRQRTHANKIFKVLLVPALRLLPIYQVRHRAATVGGGSTSSGAGKRTWPGRLQVLWRCGNQPRSSLGLPGRTQQYTGREVYYTQTQYFNEDSSSSRQRHRGYNNMKMSIIVSAN